jgi:hypothetical protein
LFNKKHRIRRVALPVDELALVEVQQAPRLASHGEKRVRISSPFGSQSGAPERRYLRVGNFTLTQVNRAGCLHSRCKM